MFSYSYDPIRGSNAINWSMASCGGPPLEPPEFEDPEADQSPRTDLDEGACTNGCAEDFETSLEPD